jgi:hypothetical protein
VVTASRSEDGDLADLLVGSSSRPGREKYTKWAGDGSIDLRVDRSAKLLQLSHSFY